MPDGVCSVNSGQIRLIMFISGILLYKVKDSVKVPTPSSLFAFLALLAGLSGTLLPVDGAGGYTLKICILFASFFVLCLCCLRNTDARLPRIFSWTPMRILGNISYSYYLLHGLALKGFFLGLAYILPTNNFGSWFFWTLLPVMFALTFPAAIGLFLLVEKPFSLLSDGIWKTMHKLYAEGHPVATDRNSEPLLIGKSIPAANR